MSNSEIFALDDTCAREMLKLAGIEPTDARAMERLQWHYRIARTIHSRSGATRSNANAHNLPLTEVYKVTEKLLGKLKTLKTVEPYAYATLNAQWRSEVDLAEPLDENLDRDRREFLTEMLQWLSKAATDAMSDKVGAPSKKQKIVQCGLDFFIDWASVKPSQTKNGKFADFSRRFYWTVTGENSDLEQPIRRVVKDSAKIIKRHEAVFKERKACRSGTP